MKELTDFFKSRCADFIYLTFGIISVMTGKEIYGIIALILIMSVQMVFCSDIGVCLTPFLIICGIAIRLYDSFDTLMGYIWVVPIAVFAVIFHFVFYRKTYAVGRSFFGICAVAVAVSLGGMGSMTVSEYLSVSVIYHMIALGIGMMLLYILLRSEINAPSAYDKKEHFARSMSVMIVFAFFMVFYAYLNGYELLAQTGKSLNIQWSNNLSTLLMMAMPFPIYLARKNPGYVVLFPISYLTMIATFSRSALLVGTIEFIAVAVYAMFSLKKVRAPIMLTSVLLLCGIAILVLKYIYLFETGTVTDFIKPDEARVKLIKRSVEDFMARPVFGRGLGYSGNTDIYSPKKGALYFYHMMIPQIIGSMGSVGILAYGYQIVDRCILWFRKSSRSLFCFGLSYFGILLMSQVNPGEFCPFPYEMLTVILFIFLENGKDSLVFWEKRPKLKRVKKL